MEVNAPLTGLVLAAAVVAFAAGPAAAATTLSSEATAWQGPDAVRLIVRIDDDDPAGPGTAASLKIYLPAAVTLDGAGLPRCSADTIRQSGIEACPDGSQVGSGRFKGTFPGEGALAGAGTDLAGDVVNGPAPDGMLVSVRAGSGVAFIVEGRLVPSDELAFATMVVLPIPIEAQHPVPTIWHALTELDVVLQSPFVAIASCPFDIRTVVGFNPDAGRAPPGPLATTATATCLAGLAPAPQPQPPPAPTTAVPERAVGTFAVRLVRRDGKVKRLRLTGVPASATVSVRCLRRCGGAGRQLLAARDGGRLRLKQRLRRRSRFELSVAQPGLVTRFARFRVDRRARTAIVLKAGCRDPKGAERVCPAG
jgi:hypothetical protein